MSSLAIGEQRGPPSGGVCGGTSACVRIPELEGYFVCLRGINNPCGALSDGNIVSLLPVCFIANIYHGK